MINNRPEDPFRHNYTSFRPIYATTLRKTCVLRSVYFMSPTESVSVNDDYPLIPHDNFFMLSYRINPKDHLLRPDLSILAEHFVLKPNIDHISISKEP